MPVLQLFGYCEVPVPLLLELLILTIGGRFNMWPVLSITLAVLVGQAVTDPPEQPAPKVRQQRYESFVRAAGLYEMRLKNDAENNAAGKNDDQHKLKMVDKPVLRWGNQARDNGDGAVFVWTYGGRPQAIVAIFVIGERPMHEMCSLAESPLTTSWGESALAWRPSRPGVVFRPIPGAPAPAATRLARLTQMRSLAGEFTAATSAPPNYNGGRSHGELRLLTQPLYRNPDESTVADGALFTFAFGTDPEALLLIEARSTPAGNVWHYAAAPFTDFAIQLKHKELPVWNEPLVQNGPDPWMERPHSGLWQDALEGARKQP